MESSSKEENPYERAENEEKERKDVSKEKEGEDKTDEEIDNFDLSTPCWFYLDSNELKQGPFSFKEMFLWWKGGYFPSELLVKTIWDEDFRQLGLIPEFYDAPIRLVERIEKEQEEQVKQGNIEVPMVPTYYEPNKDEEHPVPLKNPKFQDYAVKGTFNITTGKFQKEDSSFLEQKGVPTDRDSRLLHHYIDMNQYQQQMNALSAEGKKKKKPVKGTKKFWKERKEKKRRAKLVAEYLAD